MTVTQAAHEAIGQGQRHYSCFIAVARRVLDREPKAAEYERQRGLEDAVRGVCREQAMTEEEVAARYEFRWEGPITLEVDDEGEPVPLDAARTWVWKLQGHPRKWPLAGAVYTVRRPLTEVAALGPAIVAAADACGSWPCAVRLHPAAYAEYANAAFGPGWDELACCGVPVTMGRHVAEGELVLAFPLPSEE